MRGRERSLDGGVGLGWGVGGVGGGFLIEKASSFQEFAAEERRHNKVIKKGRVIQRRLSQDCHTLTDRNLHKQIILSALLAS